MSSDEDQRVDRPLGIVRFCPFCGSRLIHTDISTAPVEFVHCQNCDKGAEITPYVEADAG